MQDLHDLYEATALGFAAFAIILHATLSGAVRKHVHRFLRWGGWLMLIALAMFAGRILAHFSGPWLPDYVKPSLGIVGSLCFMAALLLMNDPRADQVTS